MYTETELTRLIDPTFRGGFHGASGSPPKVTNFGEDDIAEISFVKFQSAIFFENGCNIISLICVIQSELWHSPVHVPQTCAFMFLHSSLIKTSDLLTKLLLIHYVLRGV